MVWITGSRELVAAVRTAKQFLTYVASGPFQYAIAEALTLPDTYYAAFRDDLQSKRDLLAAGLRDAGFHDHPTAGHTQVRFAFCKRDDVLREAAQRLRKAVYG